MDEEIRLLEREARYNQKLSNLLQCMRQGHDPKILDEDGSDCLLSLALSGNRIEISEDTQIVDAPITRPQVNIKLCNRCKTVYWEEIQTKRCKHGRKINSDVSDATQLCNCCHNSLRLVDQQYASAANVCHQCYETLNPETDYTPYNED